MNLNNPLRGYIHWVRKREREREHVEEEEEEDDEEEEEKDKDKKEGKENAQVTHMHNRYLK